MCTRQISQSLKVHSLRFYIHPTHLHTEHRRSSTSETRVWFIEITFCIKNILRRKTFRVQLTDFNNIIICLLHVSFSCTKIQVFLAEINKIRFELYVVSICGIHSYAAVKYS
jgi:hypothetical protein